MGNLVWFPDSDIESGSGNDKSLNFIYVGQSKSLHLMTSYISFSLLI